MSRIFFASFFALATACTTAPQVTSDEALGDKHGADAAEANEKPDNLDPAEGWSDRDDPTLFSDELEFDVDALPIDGEATIIPWAGSYWPVYQDSINKRWDGVDSQSPAEKYGEAFGVEDVTNLVSKHHGIDKYQSRTACKETSECDSAMAERCAIRDGGEDGWCIPSWWGICHAWAPVSIMEPEPEHAVTRNGVEFKVQDIKALATLTYNSTQSKFVSLRCNENDSADEIEYDEYDRPTGSDEECRDTNPGTYHVLLTNYLGLKGESFVEDRTMDYQVWNQPLRSYSVTQMAPITVAEAHDLIGVPESELDEGEDGDEPSSGSGIPTHYTMEGTVADQGWNHHGSFAVDGATEVTITMSDAGEGGDDTAGADADLYVRLGSEPTESKYDCRPYLAGQNESCTLEVPEGTEDVFVSVKAYANAPAAYAIEIDIEVPGGNDNPTDAVEYKFNEDAADLYHVKLEVEYISESNSSTDGNLADRIDNYTRTDRYQYVLEVDADNKIIGGEWIGSSKRNHPDFLWLPTSRNEWPRVAQGSISYEIVKDLIDGSVASEEPEEATGDETTIEEAFTLDQGEWQHFGPFSVDGTLKAVLSGSGDADLYVKQGSAPTSTSYDCRPYKATSDEECISQGPGEFYVSVHGYQSSEVEIEITTATESNEAPEESTASSHLNESDSVDFQELALYVLEISAGDTIVAQTSSDNDVDLYVRFGYPPTTAEYDLRAYTYSGNESVSYTATSGGMLHIGVHGWEAADFTLTTSGS
jgi:hypothetical protein